MAQNLPFSVANILRSDFPHPSRLAKAPRVFYVTPPLRENRTVPGFVALRCQVDQRANHCGGAEFFGRGSFNAQTLPANPEREVFQNSGFIKEQQRKRGMLKYCFPNLLNFYSSSFLATLLHTQC